MLKRFAILSMIAFCSTADAAAPTASDVAMARINAALQLATKASPALGDAIGESNHRWLAWAQQDCKIRFGMPVHQDASLFDPKFGPCMADQMERRAEQLRQYACSVSPAVCR